MIYSIKYCFSSTKGTDMTYNDKLMKQHLGKSTAFGKVKKQGKFEAHFELYHYAGEKRPD